MKRQMTEAGQWFESDPLWFKRAVFYEVHVRGFFDANDDGSGDLRGLTDKLDYLQWLGIDCIWLLPMYPSPLRDGGYDIADFFSVHPDYGTVEDFEDVRRGGAPAGDARDRRPRRQPHLRPTTRGSRTRASPAPEARLVRLVGDGRALPGRADHLPRHRGLELDVGSDRRRVLLAPLLLAPARPQLRQPGGAGGDAERPALLARPGDRRLPARRGAVPLRARGHELREPARDARVPEAAPRARSTPAIPDRVLLAEANQWPEDVVAVLGRGATSATWPSTSRVMPRMFMAVRREDATPINEILERTPAIPDAASGGSSCATTTS